MTRESIIEKTNEFLVDEFEVNPNLITESADLKQTLDLDSLDYVDLVVSVQNIFGIKLTELDFKEISTINDFYTLIDNKVNA